MEERKMKLVVVGSETKNQSASIPIRWCLEYDEKRLFEANQYDPEKALLLVVILYQDQEITHELIKLTELMHYLTFKTAGRHTIKTAILLTNKHSQIELLLRKENQIIKDDGNFVDKNHFIDRFSVEILENSIAEAEVMVDEKFFAKKPFDWNWVNLWYERRPADQCQFRRRRFIAYTLQPILWSLWYFILAPLFKISAALATLLWGIRLKDIDWKALWFFEPVSDVGRNVDKYSDYIKYRRVKNLVDVEGEIIRIGRCNYKENPLFVRFFRPLIILSMAGLEILFLSLAPAGSILIIVHFFLFVWLALLLVFLAAHILNKLFVRQITDEEVEARILARKKVEDQKKVLELNLISCTSNPDLSPVVRALPKPKQTAQLRFLETKAKLCKPFAA